MHFIILGQSLSYGFAPDIVAAATGGGPSNAPMNPTAYSNPSIGWVNPTAEVAEPSQVSQQEVPCEAIHVPLDQIPIYINVSIVNKILESAIPLPY